MSAWITHVKNYQREHKCSYKEALQRAAPSYQIMKGGGLLGTVGGAYIGSQLAGPQHRTAGAVGGAALGYLLTK